MMDSADIMRVGITLPKIIVKDPLVHNTWRKGKFTTYLICVKTDHPSFHLHTSAVRRRFSELRWLIKVLKANHPHIHFPVSPSKKIFGERFGTDFMNSRMRDIENFLNELAATETTLSDTAFHLFIQTDLTTHEIDEYINGVLPEAVMESTWQNAGRLHISSYLLNTDTIPHEPQEIVMNYEDLQYAGQMSLSSDESDSLSSFENSVTCTHTTRDEFVKQSTPVADS